MLNTTYTTQNDSEPYLALFKTNFVPVRLSFAQDQCQYGYEMELNIFIEISWVRDLLCPIWLRHTRRAQVFLVIVPQTPRYVWATLFFHEPNIS